MNSEWPQRFWPKVNRDGPVPAHRPELGQCWVWTRSCTDWGYGKFSVAQGEWWAAHRVSWILANGPIPDGLWVLHHCDNPPCVRPDHLFLGVAKDNTQDMISKGRRPDTKGCPGELNPNAKLTVVTAEQARRRFAEGEERDALAGEFDIAPANLSRVLNGHTWTEAGGPIRDDARIGRRPGGDQPGEAHVCVSCGRKRKNQGRGLCGRCHESNRTAGTLDRFPPIRKQAAA